MWNRGFSQVGQVQLTFDAILVSHPYSVAIPGLHRNGVNKYHLQLLISLPVIFRNTVLV